MPRAAWVWEGVGCGRCPARGIGEVPRGVHRTVISAPHTVVVLAHPNLEGSRINAALAGDLAGLDGVEVRDLHALYPDGRLDLDAERRVLESVDHVVLQYPTHWYSPPGLLKTWLDNVLVRGWAYGTGAAGALAGKTLRVVTSTGGAAEAYHPDGFHGWRFDDILIPMRATARRLGMRWVDPFVVHGVREVTDPELATLVEEYRTLVASAGDDMLDDAAA